MDPVCIRAITETEREKGGRSVRQKQAAMKREVKGLPHSPGAVKPPLQLQETLWVIAARQQQEVI